MGIFLGNTMVGYVMVIYDYDLNEFNIRHMMIDKKHRGKGYGRAAGKACLADSASGPFGDSNRVVPTCHSENTTALSLCRKFGFEETGNMDEEEIRLALELTP